MTLIVIGLCSLGILFAKVTTDPIELWSSPSSRSRQEKDFFDQKFGSFYRVSQIIIKPNLSSGLGPFDYVNLFGETSTFSSIFHKE